MQEIRDENRDIYARLNRLLEGNELADTQTLFFNWGYVSVPATPDWLAPAIVPPRGINASHIRLVLELLGDAALDGRSVLDISCGRGGSLKTIAQHFQPKKLTGLDISPDNIEFCRRNLALRRARFQVADACDLPVHEASTDIVFNLESAGAYPGFAMFLAEVSRVLKPGGLFLFGDILPAALIPDIGEALCCLGLEGVKDRSINRNVLAARSIADAVETRLFDPARLRGSDVDGRLGHFLQTYRAEAGSAINRLMQAGALSYHLFQFRKAGVPKPLPSDLAARLDERNRLFHALIEETDKGKMTTKPADQWFPFGVRKDAALTIFALPHAGGGASAYRDWCGAFGPGIDFCPLQLPGREQRIGEAPLTTAGEMADACLEAIAPYWDRPFLLMGHSLGARIAFEIALRLKDIPYARLQGFIAAGCPAPDIPTGMRVSHMDAQSLRERLRKLGGTPDAILRDSEAFRAHETAIRADFAIGESYFRPQGERIAVPVLTIAANGDDHVSMNSVRRWAAFTNAHVRHETVSGGHFFIKSEGARQAQEACRTFIQSLAATGCGQAKGGARAPGQWLPFNKAGRPAALRLLCLAFAGGSANYFRPWFKEMPASIELCPIELPGHGVRFAEALPTDVTDLIPALADGVRDILDRPFAVFGHSLGALNAFLLCDHLRREGIAPQHLFVSGRRAPRRPVRLPYRHRMPDGALIEDLRRLGGMAPEILESQDMLHLMLPLLRADFRLTELYAYRDVPPFAFPVTAFAGRGDPEASPAEMAHWRHVAGAEFELEEFDGDHFYLNGPRQPGLLLQRISRILLPHAAAG